MDSTFEYVKVEEFENGLQQLSIDQEIGVIPYFSLARGFLSGKYRPDQQLPESRRAQGVQRLYMNKRGFAILEAVDQVAAKHNAKPAQISLAWSMAQSGVTAPISSGTSPKQVDELMQAVELQLTNEDLETLTNASK